MKRKSNKIIIVLSFTLIILFVSPISYFNAKDIAFLNSVEDRFSESDSDLIFIKNVTDFEWEEVCFIPPNFSYPLFGFGEEARKKMIEGFGIDYALVKKHLPFAYFSNLGTYLFINENEVVQKISYSRTYGLGFRGFLPVMKAALIRVGDARYGFSEEHSSENDFCINQGAAAFVKVENSKDQLKQILITNIEKR